jgi:hypothetical protein
MTCKDFWCNYIFSKEILFLIKHNELFIYNSNFFSLIQIFLFEKLKEIYFQSSSPFYLKNGIVFFIKNSCFFFSIKLQKILFVLRFKDGIVIKKPYTRKNLVFIRLKQKNCEVSFKIEILLEFLAYFYYKKKISKTKTLKQDLDYKPFLSNIKFLQNFKKNIYFDFILDFNHFSFSRNRDNNIIFVWDANLKTIILKFYFSTCMLELNPLFPEMTNQKNFYTLLKINRNKIKKILNYKLGKLFPKNLRNEKQKLNLKNFKKKLLFEFFRNINKQEKIYQIPFQYTFLQKTTSKLNFLKKGFQENLYVRGAYFGEIQNCKMEKLKFTFFFSNKFRLHLGLDSKSIKSEKVKTT